MLKEIKFYILRNNEKWFNLIVWGDRMEKSVMDTICSSFDNFFDSEKKIAKYIINHYDKVVDMTVGQLAKASGAS